MNYRSAPFTLLFSALFLIGSVQAHPSGERKLTPTQEPIESSVHADVVLAPFYYQESTQDFSKTIKNNPPTALSHEGTISYEKANSVESNSSISLSSPSLLSRIGKKYTNIRTILTRLTPLAEESKNLINPSLSSQVVLCSNSATTALPQMPSFEVEKEPTLLITQEVCPLKKPHEELNTSELELHAQKFLIKKIDNILPLDAVKYCAELEEKGTFFHSLYTNQLPKITPESVICEYSFSGDYTDPMEFLRSDTTESRLGASELVIASQFNYDYSEREAVLNSENRKLSTEDNPLEVLSKYSLCKVLASTAKDKTPFDIKRRLKYFHQEKHLHIALEDALHLNSARDFSFPESMSNSSSLLTYGDSEPHKAHTTMQKNPAHTLSFLHKIKALRGEEDYLVELSKPFSYKFNLSSEHHGRDLIHSVAQLKESLPIHPNPFTNYISVLETHEDQFIPAYLSMFSRSNLNFQAQFKRGKELYNERRHPLDNLSTLPSLYELNTQILSSEIKTDVEVRAKPNGKGYYFSIKLAPFYPEELKRVRQNVFFVMDQCRTINKERFTAFKKAILKALPYLHPDDTFNIIAYDSRYERLSNTNLFYTKETQKKAKRFLDNVVHGSFVSPQDYSKVLSYVDENLAPDPSELNVIVLLTDGSAYKAHQLQKEKVDHFTEMNNNRYAIHTVSAAQHNYLGALDLMSFLNRGSMLHSKSNVSLPRKLALLVKKMRYPIATDLHLTMLSSTSDHVQFFPGSGYFQNFYGHKPLTIYGESDSLCEFEFMLQGKCEDEWINVTQSIDLQQALPGDRELIRDSRVMETKTQSHILHRTS